MCLRVEILCVFAFYSSCRVELPLESRALPASDLHTNELLIRVNVTGSDPFFISRFLFYCSDAAS